MLSVKGLAKRISRQDLIKGKGNKNKVDLIKYRTMKKWRNSLANFSGNDKPCRK